MSSLDPISAIANAIPGLYSLYRSVNPRSGNFQVFTGVDRAYGVYHMWLAKAQATGLPVIGEWYEGDILIVEPNGTFGVIYKVYDSTGEYETNLGQRLRVPEGLNYWDTLADHIQSSFYRAMRGGSSNPSKAAYTYHLYNYRGFDSITSYIESLKQFDAKAITYLVCGLIGLLLTVRLIRR